VRAAVVLLLLAGCRQLFGLHEVPPAPAGDAGNDGALAYDAGDGGAIADAYPDAPAGFYRVGGMVTGLSTPATLVLRDNGGDDLTLHANGMFQFATPIQSGLAYAVTVGTQPRDQNCVVSNGSGTIGSTDVASVTVSCSMQLGILCDTAVCNPSSLLCCGTPSGFSCVSNQTSVCGGHVPIECDDSTDCGNMKFCCATTDSSSRVTGASCIPSGSACVAGAGGSTRWFCDPDDPAGTCPAQYTKCVPATVTGLPPGYYECQ
jgi:hypothetical protein